MAVVLAATDASERDAAFSTGMDADVSLESVFCGGRTLAEANAITAEVGVMDSGGGDTVVNGAIFAS